MAKPLEKEIQKAILSYLELKKHFHWRNNTGSFKTDRGGFYSFGTPGSPDIFLVSKGTIWGLEVKRKGNKASDTQKAFGALMEANGGRYEVVYSLDDVIALGL